MQVALPPLLQRVLELHHTDPCLSSATFASSTQLAETWTHLGRELGVVDRLDSGRENTLDNHGLLLRRPRSSRRCGAGGCFGGRRGGGLGLAGGSGPVCLCLNLGRACGGLGLGFGRRRRLALLHGRSRRLMSIGGGKGSGPGTKRAEEVKLVDVGLVGLVVFGVGKPWALGWWRECVGVRGRWGWEAGAEAGGGEWGWGEFEFHGRSGETGDL